MKSTPSPRSFLLLLAAAALPLTGAETADALIERGRYLVHDVAGCVDCHSPRDEKGQFLADRHLTGAVLGFAPTVPMPWAPAAPSIAGLEGYTTEQAVTFLMTGTRPSGVPPLPPMPAYRLNQADARAVVAYLQSLAKKS
ncbi:Cytochrome c [Lacunisphaera limnophila]|uniref:Cytochrome c n=1 Tax=Lacunisphaera limnophila TaxID=1838286 RepID=A0A1D8ASQ9_9BACT|nr:c-type cytochrome [Lacunisphaera limnophila]AOS43886.1 Cytochrome c [Lacunisphaera limnophila]